MFVKQFPFTVYFLGSRMLALPKVAPENAYKQRYKNIGTVFAILKRALSGSYIPFGVFRLYGDTCLQDALAMFVKLLVYIQEDEFHVSFMWNCAILKHPMLGYKYCFSALSTWSLVLI